MTTHVPDSERLIVVVGPSGAGKDSVLQAWRKLLPPAAAPAQVRRVITRPPDPHGENHEPIDEATFAPLAEGRWVVMNGSRGHLPQLRRRAPKAHVVEVTAPPEVLAQRLAGRGRENPEAVAARLARETPGSDASLVVSNTGDVAEAAQALNRWWLGLAERRLREQA